MAIDFSFIKNETLSKIADAVRSILSSNNKVKIEDVPTIIEEHYNDRIKHIVEADNFENSSTELYLDEKRLKGITKIGNHALSGWYWLKSLILPDSVTDIGLCACQDAQNLTTVQTGNSVKNIGGSAFKNCKSLQNLTIGDNVKTIGGQAFYGCEKLETVTIPDSVTTVGEGIFSGCTKLSDVIMSNGVDTIPKRAFYKCSSLKNLDTVLPWTVNTIEDSAFAFCDSIESVNLQYKTVGNTAFAQCKGLKTAFVSNSSLGTGVFSGCTALERVQTDQYMEIPEDTFRGCTSLIDLNYGSLGHEFTVGKTAFYECINFCDDYTIQQVISMGDYSFAGTGLQYIFINEKITEIPVGVFYRCSNLELVSICGNVESIQLNAFTECPKLEYIDFDGAKVVPYIISSEHTFPEQCKYRVPYSLYEEWIKADVWCDIADRIEILKSTIPAEEEESDV